MNPNELRARFRNLVSAKPRPWYRVANQAAGPTQIHIYNDIGLGGMTAEDLVDDLSKINGPVELRLNSGGGEIFEGIAIYNALCARDVAVYIDGLAGSAASFIAMAASPGKLFMAKTATMMIHDGQAIAMGNASELTSMVNVLERESQKIAAIYADRSGKDAAYFRGKMQAETWYNAEEALAEGLIDVIFDPRTGQDAATPARAAAAAAPGVLVNAATKATPAPPEGDTPIGDGWVTGADGNDRYDPDGNGDDDSTAAGDTDNSHHDADGKQTKVIPPKPKKKTAEPADGTPVVVQDTPVTPVLNAASVDTSDWDAAKAWHNGSEADDPAAFYGGICAGKKSGDPSTQAAWALPYKYTPSSPPNAAGVRNALARLSQTQGLINKTEAGDTLEAAMRKVNPDYKPGDQVEPGLLSAVLTELVRGGSR
jgi:ATP-dependent protease ClpP protease subunit